MIDEDQAGGWKAARDMDEDLERQPALLLAEARSQLWSRDATGAYGVNRLLAAVRLARQVNLLHPDKVGAWMIVGVALFRLGRKEESVNVFEEALRLRPRHPRARLWLRRALSDNAPTEHTIGNFDADAVTTTTTHAEGPATASSNAQEHGTRSTATFEGIRIEVKGGSRPGGVGERAAMTAAQACAAIASGAAAFAAAAHQRSQEEQMLDMCNSGGARGTEVTSTHVGECNDGVNSRSSVAKELKVRIKRQLHNTKANK